MIDFEDDLDFTPTEWDPEFSENATGYGMLGENMGLFYVDLPMKGVVFESSHSEELGPVAVFTDPSGNRYMTLEFDLPGWSIHCASIFSDELAIAFRKDTP